MIRLRERASGMGQQHQSQQQEQPSQRQQQQSQLQDQQGQRHDQQQQQPYQQAQHFSQPNLGTGGQLANGTFALQDTGVPHAAPVVPVALFAQSERTERIAITVEDRIVVVPVRTIVYVTSVEGKTEFVTKDQTYKVNEPLVTIERKLQHSSIVRVHRAFLVNLDQIVEIQPWFHSTYNLIMEDGSSVPVSRTYMKELKHIFGF
ncbi:LytTR family transcriptional regulator DNA-binding domain-containing protein [Paenibacillus sp. 481]|nr:LytTR family transcriptional regulator DNA-binding domain-containing protein [Paenibacillus sp. 481]